MLTNISRAEAAVLPTITNHEMVKVEQTFNIPEQSTVTRMVWQFVKADFKKMRNVLSAKP